MHHGRSRKQVVHVVHTKYEVNPSIIRDCRPIQLKNRVFEPLTTDLPIHIERGARHVSETHKSRVYSNRMEYRVIKPGVGVEYHTTYLVAGLRPPSLRILANNLLVIQQSTTGGIC